MSNDIYLCCCVIRTLPKHIPFYISLYISIKNIMRRSTQFSTSLFLSLSLVLPFACCTSTRIVGKILQQQTNEKNDEKSETENFHLSRNLSVFSNIVYKHLKMIYLYKTLCNLFATHSH